MTGKRLKDTLFLCMCVGSGRRTAYLKKHNVFHSMGENCSIMMRIVPLYPELISIGNNVNIASNVSFHCHDGLNNLFNKIPGNTKHFQEGLGCISIGDNVSIGAHAIINYGVKVGNNVIISAGSVVINDIPDNSVVRGNPAQLVCSFKDYRRIRLMKKYYPDELKPVMGKYISPELIDYMWNDFEQTHNIKKGEQTNGKQS